MKFLLTLFLLLVTFSVIKAQKWNCNQKKSARKLDDMMSRLMTVGTTRKYPEKPEELQGYCNENYRLIKQIDEYTKQCLNNVTKQSVGLLMYSYKESVDGYCKDGAIADDLFVAALCANKGTKEFGKCFADYVDVLIESKGLLNRNETGPNLCCQYEKIIECIHKTGKNIEGCTDSVLAYAEKFVRAEFDKSMNLLCASYKDTADKCIDIAKLNQKKKKKPKTFILPFIDLMKEV